MEIDLKKANALLAEIPNIKNEVVGLKKNINELETAQEYTDAEIEKIKGNLTNCHQAQSDLREDLEEKIVQNSKNITGINSNRPKVVSDDRKRNLLFLGVKENISIDVRYIICDIVSNTQIKLDPKEIDNAVRVGPFRGLNRPRPIQVSFVSTYTRNLIFQRRNYLKQNKNCLGLRIVEDLPEGVQASRYTLKVVAEQAIRMNHTVKLQGDNLFIDGTRHTAKTLDLLPEDCNLENSFIVRTQKGLAFCSEYAYPSNFYKAPFSFNGTDYVCSEQAIQGTKARVSNDPASERLIMETDDPVIMKRIGDKVIPTDVWNNNCHEYIDNILRAKFTQNPQLAKKLVSTGNVHLIEATQSSYWAIGKTILDPDLMKGKGTGKNLMGLHLETTREEMKTFIQDINIDENSTRTSKAGSSVSSQTV